MTTRTSAAPHNDKVPASEVAIWERLFVPCDEELSSVKARLVLQIRFPAEDVQLMRKLSAKARAGTLSSEESSVLEMYERVGHLVSILKSRARQVLKRTRSVS